jgi:branched-chain amino acid aminotransferase
MKIYLDGLFVDKKDATISVFDHGFLYGDGGFEGIRAYGGVVFKLAEHLDRLYETLHTMMIPLTMTKEEIAGAVVETLKINKILDGYVRVIVTRGVGDLGLDPRKCHGQPGVIIIADSIKLYSEELYKNGMEIITVPTPRNHPEAVNPLLKSLNYLNNIMAKIEANNSGYSEAIMLDHQGYVAECTGDNIFIVKRGVLHTPSHGRLQGITRDAVIALAAAEGVDTLERLLTRHEVYVADECFLTGTAAEIIPVVKVDGRQIGDGTPGPVTSLMITKFKELTRRDGVKYSL